VKKCICFFILLFVSGCSLESGVSEKIIEKFELEGKSYFDHLVATQEYESLLDKIENGDEVLIRGSSLLSQWVDASTSLSLKYSLSRAITKKPDAVMSLIPEFYSVSDVCTIPYIEAPIEVELRHVHESLSALKRSNKSNDAYIECIAVYQEIKENIAKSPGGR